MNASSPSAVLAPDASTEPATAVFVSSADLVRCQAHYDRGAYLQAFAAANALGPLACWTGAEALIFASRLTGNLGAPRLSFWLGMRAWREARAVSSEKGPSSVSAGDANTRALAALMLGFRIFGGRGPLALRRWMTRPRVAAALAGAEAADLRAHILALHARIAAAFKDFEVSEARWQEAEALAPADPWLWVERAAMLQGEDRYHDALAAARRALDPQPWYRPAVQSAAHLLSLLSRDDEALALLRDALDIGGNESAALAVQLAEGHLEAREPQPALEMLETFERFSPLLESEGGRWLASQRCEAWYQLGDLRAAAEQAERVVVPGKPMRFYAATAERLRAALESENGDANDDDARRRVHHAVPFVRQHERTCAPATLAAVSAFWQRPVDQLEVAREICYGGTFDHEERHWAETHGWVVREFRVDWPGARALLDLGIPFTLVTSWVNSGHLQAVIGYDALRGTLLIRDPFERRYSEWLAEEFFERFAAIGPRGMALAPADHPEIAERLRVLDLPEAGLYDALHRMRRALHVHDRAAAAAALDTLVALDPAARLTLHGRRELAYYDGDDPGVLEAVEALLALYPKDSRLRMEKLAALRRLARRPESLAWLETIAAGDTDKETAEPNLWRELAEELLPDARQRPRARQLLLRALTFQPFEAEHLRAFYDLEWAERRFESAAEFIRFAASIGGVNEGLWQRFFVAARHLRRTDPALALLEARFRRLGAQSSQPARTLVWAQRERHAFAPAQATLDEALRLRPADGDLLLFAATMRGREGDHARAAELLDAARAHTHPAAHGRTAAELAAYRCDNAAALALWQEVLAREPLAEDAHRAVAQGLAETDPRGTTAAHEHLHAALERFPHSVALHGLHIAWLTDDFGRSHAEHEAATRALLAVHPENVWAHRELALSLEAQGRLTDALAALDFAERLNPFDAGTHAVRGHVLRATGGLTLAQDSLRRALRLDVDLAAAITTLLEASPTLAEKRAALDFVRSELVTQTVAGDGLLAYRDAAYPILPPAELLAQLEEALAARPDLPHAWSAVMRQLTDAQRFDDAQARAAEAAERFPLLSRLWLELATTERLRGNRAAEIAALEHALRIQASLGEASRRLAEAHRDAKNFDSARAVLERAILAAPLDALNRFALAETLWVERNDASAARTLEVLADGLRREPGFDGAWQMFVRWSRERGEPERAETLARELTQTRPGEARSWLVLAQVLGNRESAERPEDAGRTHAERLAAFDRAIAANPRCTPGHDGRAELLAEAGRFDEALAACAPRNAYPAGHLPYPLAGRAAWIEALRGDLRGACDAMRAVVVDHPEYAWGWQQILAWAEALKDDRLALEAAERVAHLDPQAAPPLGFLAEIKLRLNDRIGAVAALREAMRREPGYAFAPLTLFRIQLENNNFTGAEETLAFLRTHHGGAMALSRELQLAAARGDADRAERIFAALCRHTAIEFSEEMRDVVLRDAAKAMFDSGWVERAEARLEEAMQAPEGEAHPEVGALWVRLRADRNAWRGTEKRVRTLPGEVGRRARIAYLLVLGEYQQKRRVPGFLRRARKILRADTGSWAQAGYALLRNGDFRSGALWLWDWRERAELEPWMLFNFAVGARSIGRAEEATAASRHALTLPPDQTRASHLAWIAFEDALLPDASASPPPLPTTGSRESAAASPAGQDAEASAEIVYLRALRECGLAVRHAAATGNRAAPRAMFREAESRLAIERQAPGLAAKYGLDLHDATRRARLVMARATGDAWLEWRVELATKLGLPLNPATNRHWHWWILALIALSNLLRLCHNDLTSSVSPPSHRAPPPIIRPLPDARSAPSIAPFRQAPFQLAPDPKESPRPR